MLAVVIHSAVGSAANAFRRFSAPGTASTHFMIHKTGRIDQYVDTADTAHANGVRNRLGGPDPRVLWLPDYYKAGTPSPNRVTLSVEMEGGAEPNVTEPLTAPQYGALRRLTRSVFRKEGLGTAQRHVNLLEHNQISATACPSGRIPWNRLIPDVNTLEEEDQMAWIAKVKNGQKRYLVTLGNGSLSKWHIPNPTIRKDLEKMLGLETMDLDQSTLNRIEDRVKP